MIKKNDFKIILNSVFEGFSLKCPKCSKGRIFESYLTLKLKGNCSNCGEDLSKYDVGDGPAYFGICIVGVLIPIFAIMFEVMYKPSLLTHLLVWVPAIIVFSYLVLIFSRSVFISIENKIRELEKTKKS